MLLSNDKKYFQKLTNISIINLLFEFYIDRRSVHDKDMGSVHDKTGTACYCIYEINCSVKRYSLPLKMFILIVLLLPSCMEKRSYKNMKEGEIFYNINYITRPSSLSSDLLPKELVVAFRDDLVNTRLKAPIGNTGITTVVNPAENIYDTYINILAFKYYFEGRNSEMQPGFNSMNGLIITETGKKSVICGFHCRQARVEMPGSNRERYIWYTDEINAVNPNGMTPFKEIDGVLMDFFYIIGEAEMHFTADEVIARQIPDKEFERKKNYRKVSSRFLDELIMKMISF